MRKLALLLFPLSAFAAPLCDYQVEMVGVDNRELRQALLNRSELVALQERPPASLNSLRYRATNDLPALLRTLRAYGFYEGETSFQIEEHEGHATVTLIISTGPQYAIGRYSIVDTSHTAPLPFTFTDLGVDPGTPAKSTTILNAEMRALQQLANQGHPLAVVEARKVEVNMSEHKVDASAAIDAGPLAAFGPTTLFGLRDVNPRFIENKIAWKQGAQYTDVDVDETSRRLLKSDLFGSVLISHAPALDEKGELPMKLLVSEAKHKSVAVGFSYATVDGVGGSLTWTNRNFRGLGELITFRAEGASLPYYSGILAYKKPDFLRFDQSLSIAAEVSYINIRPYLSIDYTLNQIFERKWGTQNLFSVGLQEEYIDVKESANNGKFWLIELPVFIRYAEADPVLDPTQGFSVTYACIPFQSLEHAHTHYIKQRLNLNVYCPLYSKWVVFACRIQAGSVAGAPQRDIPVPKLFFGGSEDDLRGYRYQTVSPLNATGKPKGGRSALYTTAELRFRLTQTIGLVAFGDFGTVATNPVPQVATKWFKSVGAGLRYYTYFGPLRLDIGVPLDRRKAFDPPVTVYVNIGQAF